MVLDQSAHVTRRPRTLHIGARPSAHGERPQRLSVGHCRALGETCNEVKPTEHNVQLTIKRADRHRGPVTVTLDIRDPTVNGGADCDSAFGVEAGPGSATDHRNVEAVVPMLS
jgi:hypothetical protein